MNRKIFIIVIVLFFILTSYLYPNPKILFETRIHDFGDIKEEDGKVEYQFNFINKGDEPLKLITVKASWGCATPSWSTGIINPGKSGFIKAVYNSDNRPGNFNKTVTVKSNAEESVVRLTIKGNVIPTPNKLRKKIHNLRLKATRIPFGKIKKTKIVTDTLGIQNTSEIPMEIVFEQVPRHLTFKVVPSVLKYKERGKIIATYDATKNEYGNSVDRIPIIMINDTVKTKGTIVVTATVEEDFSYMTEEDLANAPEIHFSTKNYDFGSIEKGDTVSCKFIFENKGKSNLIIRNIKVRQGCSVGRFDKVLKPGKLGVIEITFKAYAYKGRYRKNITVISNDPKNSSVTLKLSGNATRKHKDKK